MPDFSQLDDLVLHLKGLVLVRDLRRDAGADADELTRFDAEIARARVAGSPSCCSAAVGC